MKRYALALVFCVMTSSGAFAQTKSALEGVWKIVEEVAPGTNPADRGATTTYINPQPGTHFHKRPFLRFAIRCGSTS